MNKAELFELERCSAGTYATITGLRSNDSIGRFWRWIAVNGSVLTWSDNVLVTLGKAWESYLVAMAQKRAELEQAIVHWDRVGFHKVRIEDETGAAECRRVALEIRGELQTLIDQTTGDGFPILERAAVA